ncbi:MAG: sulfite exporter TauE/SafE family protein [Patescibacteria group bacterium]|nr:sulfite exporter TauE/SafE family protein [Patescibacteria group bacterium]MDD5121712.1 sulfite exporter TauE/SafE family protein [Patescibacteria group bacterium]MDD5221707.1 sulfite exporter TauE/SafE family protein [Patescibacteria group bacterium]MDD5396124.1 sulfite exporter TauE/SafE family protein [Patescibacteria group bacterium]
MVEIKLVATIFIGIVAGFLGAVAGGGGLISIPFLIFLGVPPQITLATNKFGGLGLSLGGLYKFIKEKQIVWKYAIFLSIAGILGSIIGSKILLSSNIVFLQKLIGASLIVLVPTIFLKKDFGIVEKEVSSARKILGCFLYFIVAIIASFLGGLGGISMSIVILFFGLSIIKANATELFSYSAFSLSAVIIFIFNKIIDYRVGVVLFLGMLIGGYIGAHTAIKKGNKWVKAVFSIVVVASAVKILLS